MSELVIQGGPVPHFMPFWHYVDAAGWHKKPRSIEVYDMYLALLRAVRKSYRFWQGEYEVSEDDSRKLWRAAWRLSWCLLSVPRAGSSIESESELRELWGGDYTYQAPTFQSK